MKEGLKSECYSCGEDVYDNSGAKYSLCKPCARGHVPSVHSNMGGGRGLCHGCGGLMLAEQVGRFCQECAVFEYSPRGRSGNHDHAWLGEDDGLDWPEWPPENDDEEPE